MGTIHRRLPGAFRWHGVRVVGYADPAIAGVTKQVLIGPEDGARRFALRYFEIAPGARSALDRHAHDHGVYVLTGRGRVLLGTETHEIGPGDVVYVEPGEVHQFENLGSEPLGFLCVVPPRDPT
jgi:quercetin dioxygenase-like cupin family protein